MIAGTMAAASTSCTAPLIGCAGWSIPAQHSALFGPGESTLARYATRFNAVEINSSFYRPHQRKTYERWAESVPASFRFSVKLPKVISHEQRLQRCAENLDRFVDEIGGLGDKLCCVLVQLPPSLVFESKVANSFFTALRRRMAGGIACEPRHPSWFATGAGRLWSRHDITRVAADPALGPEARVPADCGTLRYWRWHGSPRMYYSRYEDEALAGLGAAVRLHAPGGNQSLVIFDNTAHGHATADAARLQDALAGRKSRRQSSPSARG